MRLYAFPEQIGMILAHAGGSGLPQPERPLCGIVVALLTLDCPLLLQLSALGLDPWNIVDSVRRLIRNIWDMGFDAVFVGTGAGSPVFMEIPGESLAGVVSANVTISTLVCFGSCNCIIGVVKCMPVLPI